MEHPICILSITSRMGKNGNPYRAVTECNSACELNEIAGRDLGELRQEGNQVVNAVADTEICGEGRFDRREDEHRAVGSATTVNFGVFSTQRYRIIRSLDSR